MKDLQDKIEELSEDLCGHLRPQINEFDYTTVRQVINALATDGEAIEKLMKIRDLRTK